MASRLDAITDSHWKERAKAARYRVSLLARDAKTSRQNLRAFFLRHFQMPPKKWLDQQKLQDALPLLRNGHLIKQLHEQLGFGHPGNLARAFRRVIGRNPGDCRRVNALRIRRTFQKAPRLSKKIWNIPQGCARVLARQKH